MRVQIIQPVIPLYRVPFFELLKSTWGADVEIFASRESFDGLVSSDYEYVHVGGWWTLLGVLYWQRGIRLSEKLVSGDVLVICGNVRFLSNIPLIIAARRRNIGLVWWGHGWTAGSYKLYAKIRQLIMHLADSVLLYTDAEVEQFLHEGFPRQKLFAANNTIDQRPIVHAREYFDSTRLQQFKKREDLIGKKVLLFCGRITAKARLNDLIKALGILVESSGNYLLAVIGDGEELKGARDLVTKKGLGRNVRWLGEKYGVEEKAPWFMSSLCMVYPGAIGLSLLEAFSYGVPVITHSNKLNQMPEFSALEDGVNGYLFNEGDCRDLAEKISRIADNKKKQEEMSHAAIVSIERKYSIENMVENFKAAVSCAHMKRLARCRK